MDLSDLPVVLTVDEVARVLRISRGSAFAAVRRGDIPSIRIGRRILVPKETLIAWLDGTLPVEASDRKSEQ
jgi:excisionase family DNA binding protein